jgi:uncharacterized protein (DUF2141 family)
MIPRLLLLTVFVLLSLVRCATLTQPTGGPKDTIPPVLDHSIPHQNQKNFKGKIITLYFNEAVKIKDAKDIIITPALAKTPTILARQKMVTIEPKSPWKDSTTYSIAFREAIQDITESNPAENLHLAFSTGPIIDSLIISGHVENAINEIIPDKITVAIYTSDTFNIFKHKPVYFTRSNKNGFFKIENLKPGSYFIYAFDDKNKNSKVESQSEKFGFLRHPVNLTKNVDSIRIRLLNVDSRPLRLSSVRHNEKLSRVKFNKALTSYKVIFGDTAKFINNFGDDHTEINFYHPRQIKDSIPVGLHVSDSIGVKIDTLIYLKSSSSKAPKEKFSFAITQASLDYETGEVSVLATFALPIKKISKDTARISIDSASAIVIHPSDVKIDTANKQASFHCTIAKSVLADLVDPLQLYLSKGFFISIDDDSSKQIKMPIPFLKPEETGTLAINVVTQVPDFEIQLITKDYKIVQSIRNTKQIVFKNVPPAKTYKLRAIIDRNKNGKWDPGNYFLNEEPERMVYYQTLEGKYEFPIRANWEVGPYQFSF